MNILTFQAAKNIVLDLFQDFNIGERDLHGVIEVIFKVLPFIRNDHI